MAFGSIRKEIIKSAPHDEQSDQHEDNVPNEFHGFWGLGFQAGRFRLSLTLSGGRPAAI